MNVGATFIAHLTMIVSSRAFKL